MQQAGILSNRIATKKYPNKFRRKYHDKEKIIACLGSCVVVTALMVSAASAANLHASQNIENSDNTYSCHYDIGSIAPYDDAKAAAHSYVGSGSGRAFVDITGENGGETMKSSTARASNGWVMTDWAVVEGQDYASSVYFSGKNVHGNWYQGM
ncbi:MAG: hypothetical protein PHU79_00960 [Oscillospiraceae bacterium]|nr:hypothetical protein [Oscillospiraceae bacterium]